MRKILLIGALVGMAMFGAVNADTDCGGEWLPPGGECAFQCFAGQTIYVWGYTFSVVDRAQVRVRAYCGGITVTCTQTDHTGEALCVIERGGRAIRDDENGTCAVASPNGFGEGGWFFCGSYTPESADAVAEVGRPWLALPVPDQNPDP